jgi:alkylhydroperoxidase family enzyme
VLATQFYEPGTVAALPEGLDDTDAAIMEFAAKVAADAASITREDVQRLRDVGLRDDEIVDVVLAAAARGFFSTVLDALGAEPDSVYNELEPALRDALTVGRPLNPAP